MISAYISYSRLFLLPFWSEWNGFFFARRTHIVRPGHWLSLNATWNTTHSSASIIDGGVKCRCYLVIITQSQFLQCRRFSILDPSFWFFFMVLITPLASCYSVWCFIATDVVVAGWAFPRPSPFERAPNYIRTHAHTYTARYTKDSLWKSNVLRNGSNGCKCWKKMLIRPARDKHLHTLRSQGLRSATSVPNVPEVHMFYTLCPYSLPSHTSVSVWFTNKTIHSLRHIIYTAFTLKIFVWALLFATQSIFQFSYFTPHAILDLIRFTLYPFPKFIYI